MSCSVNNRSYLSPVGHSPYNAANARHLDNLLVPTQQHTHCSCGRLVRPRSATDLAESASRLWRHLAAGRLACAGRSLPHPFVANSPGVCQLIHDNPEGRGSHDGVGSLHVLHEHVQSFAATLSRVDALEEWAHVASLDGLQNLHGQLQVRILYPHCQHATTTDPSHACCPPAHRRINIPWSLRSRCRPGNPGIL